MTTLVARNHRGHVPIGIQDDAALDLDTVLGNDSNLVLKRKEKLNYVLQREREKKTILC